MPYSTLKNRAKTISTWVNPGAEINSTIDFRLIYE